MAPDVLEEVIGDVAGSISLLARNQDDSFGGGVENGEDHVVAGFRSGKRAGEIPGYGFPSVLRNGVGLKETVGSMTGDFVALTGIAALHVLVDILMEVRPMIVPSNPGGSSFPVIMDGGTVVVGHRNDELAEYLGDKEAGVILVEIVEKLVPEAVALELGTKVLRNFALLGFVILKCGIVNIDKELTNF